MVDVSNVIMKHKWKVLLILVIIPDLILTYYLYDDWLDRGTNVCVLIASVAIGWLFGEYQNRKRRMRVKREWSEDKLRTLAWMLRIDKIPDSLIKEAQEILLIYGDPLKDKLDGFDTIINKEAK